MRRPSRGHAAAAQMWPKRFRDHAVEWLEEKKYTTRTTTWNDYESVVRVWLLPAWSGRRLKSITSEDARDLLATVGEGRRPKVRAVLSMILDAIEIPSAKVTSWHPTRFPLLWRCVHSPTQRHTAGT